MREAHDASSPQRGLPAGVLLIGGADLYEVGFRREVGHH
jgi:hypothetical protein